jgi:acyl-CoA synthetase (NDP forming)
MNHLQPLLSPQSIAIVGASADFNKVNGRALKHLRNKGYAGRIYPINPKYSELAGLRCYASVAELPEPVDLAIVAVPARAVLETVRELGAQGAKSAIVFSSGFAEMGTAGRALEREVLAAARSHSMRLCGPNCLGLINAFDRVIATFGQYADGETPPGPVGFVTQSGAFGTAIAALARRRGLGFGYFVNTGNEADVSFAEVMQAVLADPRVRVGAGYIEGLKHGQGLIDLAHGALAAGKPLALAKVGRSDSGARAAASHTGSLAGADRVFDGVVRQHGIVRARNEEQMLDIVEAFTYCALPAGRGLGIITQSGGAGVLMADRAEELGLAVPQLSAATQQALRDALPAFGAPANPVDITGQFLAEPALLRDSVRIVLADPEIDAAIIWIQLMEAYTEQLVALFREIKAQATKPFVVCWVAARESAVVELHAAGIACLRGAEPAVDAVAGLMQYAEARRHWNADESARGALRVPRVELAGAAGVIPTLEAARLLKACGATLAPAELARSAEEAVACAQRLGYPVALKIESRDIPHKTEVEGVSLALANAAAVDSAFTQIVSNAQRHRPAAKVEGVVVQAMAAGEVELVVGLKRDPVFGVVVMVGLGGIYVEVLKDIVFRKAPITRTEAGRMLDELKGRAILDGLRGKPAVDRGALTALISAVSLFGAAAASHLLELDLNPVLAGPRGAVAVDWLLICQEEPGAVV